MESRNHCHGYTRFHMPEKKIGIMPDMDADIYEQGHDHARESRHGKTDQKRPVPDPPLIKDSDLPASDIHDACAICRQY